MTGCKPAPQGQTGSKPAPKEQGKASWKPAPQEQGQAGSKPAPHSGRGWDHVAAWYDKLVGDAGSDYHQNIILPAALRMLALRGGERVLDLCCGQGVLARALLAAQVGQAGHFGQVGQVVGVDASRGLIEAAKARVTNEKRVRFLVGDAEKGGDWADGSFDAAACIMAVQDVANPDGLFGVMSRSLRAGGRAVVVMMHPCFRVPRQSSWGWDYERKAQYRRIDRYASRMNIPIANRPGADPGVQTTFFHRPLADYVNGLGAAGLAIVACEELLTHRRADEGGRSRGENRAAEEIPVFLGLTAVKVEGSRLAAARPRGNAGD